MPAVGGGVDQCAPAIDGKHMTCHETGRIAHEVGHRLGHFARAPDTAKRGAGRDSLAHVGVVAQHVLEARTHHGAEGDRVDADRLRRQRNRQSARCLLQRGTTDRVGQHVSLRAAGCDRTEIDDRTGL